MSFMPGMFPAGAAAAKRSIVLSFIAATTSVNSATITGSASIVAGDVLVLLDSVWNSGALPPASSVPTGFTQITTAAGVAVDRTRMTISFKLATGAEASASITGMTGSGGAAKVLSVFRGAPVVSAISAFDPGQEHTTGNPTAQTITAGGGVAPLLVIGAYSGELAVNPRTFTVGGSAAKDGETQASGGTFINSWLAYKIYNASPADVVVDMDDEGSDNTLESCYLQVS
jgi:hypothetical protein